MSNPDIKSAVTHNVWQALCRPANYASLSLEEQWRIDDRLGILDWDPTPEEIKQYRKYSLRHQAKRVDFSK